MITDPVILQIEYEKLKQKYAKLEADALEVIRHKDSFGLIRAIKNLAKTLGVILYHE